MRERPVTTYRFVGGKGGVGKTTCAAAIAVTAARRGERVLVVSTDPASSLGEIFKPGNSPPETGMPRRVRLGRRELHVLELDAARALERWVSGRRNVLEQIALRGTWLDEADVARLLGLSLPGIDEVAALIELARLGRSREFDTIVVDTAPTGHTLRMFSMPDTLRGVARVFDRMQEKHRVMVAALRGCWTPDAADALVEEIDRDGRELNDLFHDPARVRMSWVTLPEPMAIAESVDALTHLASHGIPLDRVVVNLATPRPARPCARCDARLAFEARAIAGLQATMPGTKTAVVAERDAEPRDLATLAAIGGEIEEGPGFRQPARIRSRRWQADIRGERGILRALVPPGTRLLLLGGKGGTGKTTCAAAIALDAAAADPARRVLLLSTDPAHSLADVLGCELSNAARAVPGGPPNLEARELDATCEFERTRARYESGVDALFERITRGSSAVDTRGDRAVMQGLIELAPPGVDELAAVIDITDALDGTPRGFDLIVMDTAPSGHALRLLEMPAVVHDWVKGLMSVVLKYQSVVGVGELGTMLLALSQGLGRLRALLTDRERARFIAVTRAAALPRAETARLLGRLAEMRIDVPAVIVNAVGRGTCPRCRISAAAETRELGLLARTIGGSRGNRRVLIAAPAEVPAPHGVKDLLRWGALWRMAPARGGR